MIYYSKQHFLHKDKYSFGPAILNKFLSSLLILCVKDAFSKHFLQIAFNLITSSASGTTLIISLNSFLSNVESNPAKITIFP